MPKPRKAKKVSATLETMSWNDGYPENASSDGSRLTSVTTEKTIRMPSTTIDDHRLGARHRPATRRCSAPVITRMISAAKTLIQAWFSSANVEVA